MFKLLWGIRK